MFRNSLIAVVFLLFLPSISEGQQNFEATNLHAIVFFSDARMVVPVEIREKRIIENGCIVEARIEIPRVYKEDEGNFYYDFQIVVYGNSPSINLNHNSSQKMELAGKKIDVTLIFLKETNSKVCKFLNVARK